MKAKSKTAIVIILFVLFLDAFFHGMAQASPLILQEVDMGAGNGPKNIRILDVPAIQRAYTSNFSTNTVGILNLTLSTISAIPINGGTANPWGLAVYNDGTNPRVYVTNKTQNSVSVIDASGGNDVELTGAGYPITVGGNPMGIDVLNYTSPSHKVYVVNNSDGSISVINGDTHGVIKTITGLAGPYGAAANSVTHKVYITNSLASNVKIINADTDVIEGSVAVGSGPKGIAVDETTNLIYVACSTSSNVYVINGNTNSVQGTIAVSGGPEMVDVMPDPGLIYVTVPSENKVHVYRAKPPYTEVANSPLATASGPSGIAGARKTPGEPWYIFSADTTANKVTIIEETDTYAPAFGGISAAVDGAKSIAQGGPTVVLNWAAAQDISSPITYDVYASTTSGGQNFGAPPLFSTTSFGTVTYNTGLQYASTYYFVVRARDASAEQNRDTNVVQKSAKLTDGAAPVGGALTGATNNGKGGQIDLSWTTATDETPPITYNIYSGTSPGSLTLAFATSSATGATVTGLQNGTLYYFLVKAKDNAGLENSNSSPMSATPTDVTAPAFSGLSTALNTGAGGTVSLSWTPATDNSMPITYVGYVEQGTTVHFITPVFTTTNTSYTVQNLTNGTQFSFAVRAKDKFDNTDTNTVVQTVVPTDATVPVFSGISSCSDPGLNGKARLQWGTASDNSTPIYYNIYQATSSGGQNFASWSYHVTATNSILVGGLTNGQRYYFVTRAQDSAAPPNEETNVAECSVKPTDGAAPVFSGLSSATPTGQSGKILLQWAAATDNSPPVAYNIYRAISVGGENLASWTYRVTATTSFTVTGLTDGAEYYFVVRAQDVGGLEDSNLIEKHTKPNDGTPPVFAGVSALTDLKTSGAMSASWSAATDPAQPVTYEIFLSTTSGGQNFSSPYRTTTATSLQLTGLPNNVTYYVVVRARDSGGVTDTNVVERSATTTDSTAPVFAGISSATDKAVGGLVELNWSAATDPSTPLTYYVYQRIPPAAFNYASPSYITQARPYQISGLTNGVTYGFSVGAVDNASPTHNIATNTVERSVTPTDFAAPVFSGVQSVADAQTNGAISVSWYSASDNSGIAQYNIYCATNTTVLWSSPFATASGFATHTTITGLQNSRLYYVGVRAVDNSSNHNIDQNTQKKTAVPTDVSPPIFGGLVSAVDTTQGAQVALTWSPASDLSTPITYNIYYAANSPPSFLGPNSWTQNATGSMVTGLTNGSLYYFVVRARDHFGNESTQTTPVTVTPTDAVKPVFAGLQSAANTGKGGEVTLTWNPATDNSLPITYNVYQASASGSQNFSTPDYTATSTSKTISGLADGTTYYFVVRARDASTGHNEDTNAVQKSVTPTDTTAPQFTGISNAVAETAGNAVLLTWNAATDRSLPITYAVYTGDGPGRENFSTPSYITQATSLHIGGLIDNTWYYFVVRARDYASTPNSDGNTVEKGVRPRDTLAPSSPSNISATAGDASPTPGDEFVTLTWDAPTKNVDDTALTDLAGFNVYRSTLSGSYSSTPLNATDGIDNDGDGMTDAADTNGDLIRSNAIQYTDSQNIVSGTNYYYIMTAADDATPRNQSPLSGEKSATPRNADNAVPQPPSNLTATPSDGRVSLTWEAPLINTDETPITDLLGFNVYRSTTQGGNYSLISPMLVTQVSYQDAAVTNGTKYFYAVTAVDSATPPNESGFSDEANATPNPTGILAPAPPANFTVTSSSGSATLSWAAPTTNSDGSPLTDLAGYNIYKSTTSPESGFVKVNSSALTSVSYTDFGLTNGNTYYYYVKAMDTSSNESIASQVKSALYATKGVDGYVTERDASGGAGGAGYPKTGVIGITIQLRDQSNNVLGSAISDSEGYFKIPYNNPQQNAIYVVTEVVTTSSGYLLDMDTVQNGQGYRIVSSNVKISTGITRITVPSIGRGPVVGDADCSGTINLADFVSMKQSYGSMSGDSKYHLYNDFDGDGNVDLADFVILKSDYGLSGTVPPQSLCQE